MVVDVQNDAGRVRSMPSRKEGDHSFVFFIQEHGYWELSKGCIV